MLAFCLVGAQESGDYTVAKQVVINAKHVIETNPTLRKFSTGFSLGGLAGGGDNGRRESMAMFKKMSKSQSTEDTSQEPRKKSNFSVKSLKCEIVDEVKLYENKYLCVRESEEDYEDEEQFSDEEDEEYELMETDDSKRHSVLNAIVTVHNKQVYL
uniref:TPR_REGION domain-containing protein n=1 Tax=Rhabditophanes sp. KR3021 TaxID=114890 RepID=A0AC35UC72_9BILA